MSADLLRRAAAKIRERVREDEAVQRYAGDDYAVTSAGFSDPDVAERVAETMEAAADRVHAGALIVAPSVTGRLVALARRILGEDA